MTDDQERQLYALMRELCSAQDDVTHFNEHAQALACQKAKEARAAWMRRIVEYVNTLSSGHITVNQSAGTVEAGSVITGLKIDSLG